ncbi:MAG: sigma factor-like helix-turn-helix DNA-binding protein [Jatrophihabitans sp.]
MAETEPYFAGLVSWSQDVRAALRRLDPTQSRIIQMIYFERRTPEQVATELALPKRTVTRSMAAGLQALAVLVLAE